MQRRSIADPSINVVDSMEVLHARMLDRKSDIAFEDGRDRLTLTDDRGSLQSGLNGRDGKYECFCSAPFPKGLLPIVVAWEFRGACRLL